eukprot:418685-Rhodomonas_salina.1
MLRKSAELSEHRGNGAARNVLEEDQNLVPKWAHASAAGTTRHSRRACVSGFEQISTGTTWLVSVKLVVPGLGSFPCRSSARDWGARSY